MSCPLTAGAVVDCTTIVAGGIKRFLMMYTYSDWASMVADGVSITRSATGEITGITNPVGVQAYKFEVPDNSGISPTNPLVEQEGNVDMYDHALDLSVFAKTQEARNNVDIMRFGVVCIILENDGYGAVYGDEQGMKLTANNFNPREPETGNIIPITLTTDSTGPRETRMPPRIFDTDAATTEALILGLENVGVL